MAEIKQYLFSIIAASIICSICISLSSKSSLSQRTIKLLSGIFLIITIIAPWSGFRFNNVLDHIDDLNVETSHLVTSGTDHIAEETSAIISERIAAYVLEKGAALGATLDIDVDVSKEPPYTPNSITIKGNISPYARNTLKQTIFSELGIPKEQQQWD